MKVINTNGITYFYPKDIKNPVTNKNEVVIGDIFVEKNKVTYDNKELVLEYDDKGFDLFELSKSNKSIVVDLDEFDDSFIFT